MVGGTRGVGGGRASRSMPGGGSGAVAAGEAGGALEGESLLGEGLAGGAMVGNCKGNVVLSSLEQHWCVLGGFQQQWQVLDGLWTVLGGSRRCTESSGRQRFQIFEHFGQKSDFLMVF